MGEVNNVLATDRLVKMLSFLVLTSQKEKTHCKRKGRGKRRRCAQFKWKKRENKESRAKTKKVRDYKRARKRGKRAGKQRGKMKKKTKET